MTVLALILAMVAVVLNLALAVRRFGARRTLALTAATVGVTLVVLSFAAPTLLLQTVLTPFTTVSQRAAIPSIVDTAYRRSVETRAARADCQTNDKGARVIHANTWETGLSGDWIISRDDHGRLVARRDCVEVMADRTPPFPMNIPDMLRDAFANVD